jgi:cysteine desulfurase
MCAAALDEFLRVERDFAANPLASHSAGRAAGLELERATEKIAALLGCLPCEIICTSGAGEANNLAIKGISAMRRHTGQHILSTPLEHPTTGGALAHLAEMGYEIEMLRLEKSGQIAPAYLREVSRKDTILLAISAVDSELGIIQAIPHDTPYHVHIDAAQMAAPRAFHGATVAISAHKFGGPAGTGLLVKPADTVLQPLIHGGRGAQLYRGGTPALSQICAMAAALEDAHTHAHRRNAHIAALREEILAALPPHIHVNSPPDGAPHILNLSVTGKRGHELAAHLDAHGILASVKSACSGDNTPSRAVLAATGDRRRAASAFRISLSHTNTREEIPTLLAALAASVAGRL